MLFPLLSFILANFMQTNFAAYPVLALSHELPFTHKMFFERVYPILSLLSFVVKT